MTTMTKERAFRTKKKMAQGVAMASAATRKVAITLPRLKFMEINMEKKYGLQKIATDR